MKTILVTNPKGGSGKTTLSVNLSGFLAHRGKRVALLDMDMQQSAADWLSLRPDDLPKVHPMKFGAAFDNTLDWMVVDSAAGSTGSNLARSLVNQADKIIVPIIPSLFDLLASQAFLKDLIREKKVRNSSCTIGVVGMRMEPKTRAAQALEHFLSTIDLPILAYLRETQVYVNAAFEGKSLFDMPHHVSFKERNQWAYIQEWLMKH